MNYELDELLVDLDETNMDHFAELMAMADIDALECLEEGY